MQAAARDAACIPLILAPAWVRTIVSERVPPCSIHGSACELQMPWVEDFEEVCRFSLFFSPVFGGYHALAGTSLLVKMFAEQ